MKNTIHKLLESQSEITDPFAGLEPLEETGKFHMYSEPTSGNEDIWVHPEFRNAGKLATAKLGKARSDGSHSFEHLAKDGEGLDFVNSRKEEYEPEKEFKKHTLSLKNKGGEFDSRDDSEDEPKREYSALDVNHDMTDPATAWLAKNTGGRFQDPGVSGGKFGDAMSKAESLKDEPKGKFTDNEDQETLVNALSSDPNDLYPHNEDGEVPVHPDHVTTVVSEAEKKLKELTKMIASIKSNAQAGIKLKDLKEIKAALDLLGQVDLSAKTKAGNKEKSPVKKETPFKKKDESKEKEGSEKTEVEEEVVHPGALNL